MKQGIYLLAFFAISGVGLGESFADCPSSSDVKTTIKSLVKEKKEANFNITTTKGFLINKKTATQRGKFSLNKTLSSDFKIESPSENASGCKYYIVERGVTVGSIIILK